MQKLDLKKLEDELYRHGLAGFRRLRDAHPMDEFYCFAFYTSGEFSYVALTASTFEGLDKVAQDYKKKPPYKALSIEDLRLDLKWSPAIARCTAQPRMFYATSSANASCVGGA